MVGWVALQRVLLILNTSVRTTGSATCIINIAYLRQDNWLCNVYY